MNKVIVLLFLIAMRIVFNVFLPTLDAYSNVSLAYKTFTFSLGESLILAGCRVCQGKDETEIYSLKNKSCQPCLKNSAQIPDKVVFGELLEACGLSYEVLNKMHEIEKKDACENVPLSLSLHFNSTTNSNV